MRHPDTIVIALGLCRGCVAAAHATVLLPTVADLVRKSSDALNHDRIAIAEPVMSLAVTWTAVKSRRLATCLGLVGRRGMSVPYLLLVT